MCMIKRNSCVDWKVRSKMRCRSFIQGCLKGLKREKGKDDLHKYVFAHVRAVF